ncbi:MAG: hypothetical protein JNK04_04880 [Myxococcales bacterium]|nr:hypothetical protein [Myxococcales bacterium]
MNLPKLASISALLATFTLAGCDEHFTTQEAYSSCEQLVGAPEDSPAAFADCVSCYEDCGNACTLEGSAPITYTCPDESEEGEGGGSET